MNQGQDWVWGCKKDQRGWREEGLLTPDATIPVTESKDSCSQKSPIMCGCFHSVSKELNVSLGQKKHCQKEKGAPEAGQPVCRAGPSAQFLFYLWVQRETKLGLEPVEQCRAVYTQPGPGHTLQLCGRCSWMQTLGFIIPAQPQVPAWPLLSPPSVSASLLSLFRLQD